MSEEEFKMNSFGNAEAELQSVAQWLEDCQQELAMEHMDHRRFDKMMVIDIAFHVKANINKMGMMYAALFMLSKNYNRHFASYLGKERLSNVMQLFENMKDIIANLKHSFPHDGIGYMPKDETSDTKNQAGIFDANLIEVIHHIDAYSDTHFVQGLNRLLRQFYKVLLASQMLCQAIVQREQNILDAPEILQAIYQQNCKEAWETVKEFAGAFHEEDFKEEMATAKKLDEGNTELLRQYYHQWTPQLFKRHAIAVHMLHDKLMRLNNCQSAHMLFPENPEKEQDAIFAAEHLDGIIVKTRKVNHSDNRQFATRCIVYLKKQLGYDGTMSAFLAFLESHYEGKRSFPDLSAFSVDSKKMLRLEAHQNTVDGILKMKQLNKIEHEQAMRIKHILAHENALVAKSTIRISA